MIAQFGIALFGVTAIWLASSAKPAHNKWAPVYGLLGQPFWLWSAFEAQQWGRVRADRALYGGVGEGVLESLDEGICMSANKRNVVPSEMYRPRATFPLNPRRAALPEGEKR